MPSCVKFSLCFLSALSSKLQVTSAHSPFKCGSFQSRTGQVLKTELEQKRKPDTTFKENILPFPWQQRTQDPFCENSTLCFFIRSNVNILQSSEPLYSIYQMLRKTRRGKKKGTYFTNIEKPNYSNYLIV